MEHPLPTSGRAVTTLELEVVIKRLKRFAEYEGQKIEASPIILAKQRFFKAGVVIEHVGGERFVFSDLGNRVY